MRNVPNIMVCYGLQIILDLLLSLNAEEKVSIKVSLINFMGVRYRKFYSIRYTVNRLRNK